jgi:hypothetical protein
MGHESCPFQLCRWISTLQVQRNKNTQLASNLFQYFVLICCRAALAAMQLQKQKRASAPKYGALAPLFPSAFRRR